MGQRWGGSWPNGLRSIRTQWCDRRVDQNVGTGPTADGVPDYVGVPRFLAGEKADNRQHQEHQHAGKSILDETDG